MAISDFVPEIWSAQLLTSLKKVQVFANLCNRDYEGEIAAKGDTVHITSISRPTIAQYVKDSTVISPETLTDAQLSLVIDQSYYFAFEIDDIDRRQAYNAGALMAEAANEAAYALSDQADLVIIAAMEADALAANKTTATSVAADKAAVSALVTMKGKLDAQNVPAQGRWAIVPPWFEALLLQDSRYIWMDAMNGGIGLKNGQVGRVMGFDIILSPNLTLSDTVNDSTLIAGHPMAVTYADQINKVEAYRPQGSFSDALKGLHLYGVKVVRPAALATFVASQT